MCHRSQVYEVVSGDVRHEHLIHLLQPAHDRLAHAPHGLRPSEALLDQLALLVRNGVARTRGYNVGQRRVAGLDEFLRA